MKARSLAAGRKNKIAVKIAGDNRSLIPVVKNNMLPTKIQAGSKRSEEPKIASPESVCLFFSNFLRSGKGSWENQISSGEAVSVFKVGLDQSATEPERSLWKCPEKL